MSQCHIVPLWKAHTEAQQTLPLKQGWTGTKTRPWTFSVLRFLLAIFLLTDTNVSLLCWLFGLIGITIVL